MNKLLLVMITLAATSSFASDKICFGADSNVKGNRFELHVTQGTATIKNSNDNDIMGLNGKFPFTKIIAGQNGKTQRAYHMNDGDGSSDLIVEEQLLKAGTEGRVKVRWQGEGFNQDAYFCRDNK